MVDQLEELFTSGFSPDVRQKYISAIAGLVRSGRVFILAALRSDFYSSYQEFPELIELTKPSGKIDLRPPTAYEIGNMIRLPAEAAGLRFEQDRATGQRLDEALRDAAATTPESLPLLEHVLSLLYDVQASRGDHLLRWSDYRELGELKGALAKHAETIFEKLQPDEQGAFPLVMRYLVTLGQGEEEVPNRRTVPYRDFIAGERTHSDQRFGAKGFVDLFVEQRLLVADTDPQGEVTVSVAHEALLREWQRIKEWLIENREFLRMRDRLDSSLKLWLSRGKQKDDLLGPGLPLAEGEKLVKDFASSLSRGQTDYVFASITEQKRRQRIREQIRYGVMAGITAALIVAVIFGVVSFRQYRRAERAKVSADQDAKQATLARDEAEKLINFMTIDLRDKLNPIGRLDLLSEVNQWVRSYYQAFGGRDESPDILRRRAEALRNEGDVLLDQGFLANALQRFQESLTVGQLLQKKAPDNANYRSDLSASYHRIGKALEKQGNTTDALKNYQLAAALREQLVSESPRDGDNQHQLFVVLQEVGWMLKSKGDLTGALNTYQRALGIAEKLAKQEPDNLALADDLGFVQMRIGEVSFVQGRLSDALGNYQASLKTRQSILKRDPDDIRWPPNVALSFERIGEVQHYQGDLTGALDSFKNALKIRQDLATRDPQNITWESDLALSYEDVGNILIERGENNSALANFHQCLTLREDAASHDETNSERQRELSIVYDRIGSLVLRRGELTEALIDFEKFLGIAQKLVGRDPNNTHWQRDLGIAYEQIGHTRRAQAKSDDALDAYNEAFFIRQRLAEKDPTNSTWQSDLAWSYQDIGDVDLMKNDPAAALTTYKSSLSITERLAQSDPTDRSYQSDLATIYEKLGEALASQGTYSDALHFFQDSLTTCEQLVKVNPDNAQWKSCLALSSLQIALVLEKTGEFDSAAVRAMLEKARNTFFDLRQRSALGAEDATRLNAVLNELQRF